MENLILLPSFQVLLVLATVSLAVFLSTFISERLQDLSTYFPVYSMLTCLMFSVCVVMHAVSYWIYFVAMG